MRKSSKTEQVNLGRIQYVFEVDGKCMVNMNEPMEEPARPLQHHYTKVNIIDVSDSNICLQPISKEAVSNIDFYSPGCVSAQSSMSLKSTKASFETQLMPKVSSYNSLAEEHFHAEPTEMDDKPTNSHDL